VICKIQTFDKGTLIFNAVINDDKEATVYVRCDNREVIHWISCNFGGFPTHCGKKFVFSGTTIKQFGGESHMPILRKFDNNRIEKRMRMMQRVVRVLMKEMTDFLDF
jgi:hypothetical protein